MRALAPVLLISLGVGPAARSQETATLAADPASSHDVVFQAQIRAGDKLVGASKPRPVALETKEGTPLPETNEMGLDALSPGPYELRVLVVDRTTNVSVQRTLDFTVE